MGSSELHLARGLCSARAGAFHLELHCLSTHCWILKPMSNDTFKNQIFEQSEVPMAVKYLTLKIRATLLTLFSVVLGPFTECKESPEQKTKDVEITIAKFALRFPFQ